MADDDPWETASRLVRQVWKAREALCEATFALALNLAALRQLAGDRGFRRWCRRNALRPSAVRSLLRCAETFGQMDDIAGAFDASALLLLSSERAPRDAARIALDRARVDGWFVSYRVAREIIDGCGGPLPRRPTSESE